MLEFNPPCRFGSPQKSASNEPQELQNFSVLRDESEALIGFAVSDGEVKDPVLCVIADPLMQRVWLQTQEAFFFISYSDLPADVIHLVSTACQSAAPITVYSLPAQDNEDDKAQGDAP